VIVNKNELEHIALAARIELGSDESVYWDDLNRILRSLDVLVNLNLEGVMPTGRIGPQSNMVRKDELTDPFPKEYNLKNAPALRGRYFRVPRIL